MKRALALLALSLASCAEQELPEASFWKVADFADLRDETANFGGWGPRQLLAPVGTALFFEENEVSVLNDGLVVQPGVSGSTSAPFVITEIWQNHPVTWIQPVWVPFRPSLGARPPGAVNVFSVDIDSTFYSPFWQLEVVANESLQDANVGFATAREALAVMDDDDTTHSAGPLVYCPFIPPNTFYAQAASGVRDPVTLGALEQLVVDDTIAQGLVEGVSVNYIGFGVGRLGANNQLPIASRAYFWVSQFGGPVLPIAAVLPSQPKTRSFVTRVDALLPPEAGVYVPTSRPELRRKLQDLGLRVPPPSLANDGVDARALQVALDSKCFVEDALASCIWLDSEAALNANGVWLDQQPVQLAIGVVGP